MVFFIIKRNETKFGVGLVGGYLGSVAGENLVDYLWELDKTNDISIYRRDIINITKRLFYWLLMSIMFLVGAIR